MSKELEQSLIGDVLVAPEHLVDVRKIVQSPEFFVNEDARLVWSAICEITDEHGTVDFPLLNERPNVKRLGPAVVDWVVGTTGIHAVAHAKQLAEEYIERRVKSAVTGLAAELDSLGVDPFELVDIAVSKLSDLKSTFIGEAFGSAEQSTHEALDHIDKLTNRSRDRLGFGFADIDRITGGMDDTDLTIVAAPEKSGKTTLMLQTAFYNARHGRPVAIFSTEMHRSQLMLRHAMIDERLSYVDLVNNKLAPEEWTRLSKRLSENSKLPIWIRHGSANIVDLITDAKEITKRHKIQLICVDYIQRVIPVSRKNDNREREVAAISSGLKNLALDGGVPVLALSQVNDDMRTRESRALEQDMDRGIYIDPERPEGEKNPNGHLAKIKIRQRMGVSTDWKEMLYYDLFTGSWKNGTSHEMTEPREDPRCGP